MPRCSPFPRAFPLLLLWVLLFSDHGTLPLGGAVLISAVAHRRQADALITNDAGKQLARLLNTILLPQWRRSLTNLDKDWHAENAQYSERLSGAVDRLTGARLKAKGLRQQLGRAEAELDRKTAEERTTGTRLAKARQALASVQNRREAVQARAQAEDVQYARTIAAVDKALETSSAASVQSALQHIRKHFAVLRERAEKDGTTAVDALAGNVQRSTERIEALSANVKRLRETIAALQPHISTIRAELRTLESGDSPTSLAGLRDVLAKWKQEKSHLQERTCAAALQVHEAISAAESVATRLGPDARLGPEGAKPISSEKSRDTAAVNFLQLDRSDPSSHSVDDRTTSRGRILHRVLGLVRPVSQRAAQDVSLMLQLPASQQSAISSPRMHPDQIPFLTCSPSVVRRSLYARDRNA